MTELKYGKTIDGMISLCDVFNRRKIRLVLKYAFVGTEEMALRVVFRSGPNCPGAPGQFGPFHLMSLFPKQDKIWKIPLQSKLNTSYSLH
jgi:hypothetical protein